MRRLFVLASALVLTGAVLSGCGGGVRQEVLQESKQFLGDGHPKILRIETVHDVGGNRLVVATLEGHFKPIAASCGLGPCHPSRSISYAWLNFSQPKDMSGFGTTSASQIAAINNARSAKPIFGTAGALLLAGAVAPAMDLEAERVILRFVIEQLRAAAEAMNRGDPEPFVSLFAEDAEWRGPTSGRLWWKHTPS